MTARSALSSRQTSTLRSRYQTFCFLALYNVVAYSKSLPCLLLIAQTEEEDPGETSDILRVEIDELINEDDQPQVEYPEGFNPEFRVNTWQHTILGEQNDHPSHERI